MLKEILNNPKVSSACEVIAEYEIRVGDQNIKFKIKRDSSGFYFHTTSHYYQGPQQASPYISSRNIYETKEQAIVGAVNQITCFYDESHEYPEDNWIVNESY
jgi:hypothetical protein